MELSTNILGINTTDKTGRMIVIEIVAEENDVDCGRFEQKNKQLSLKCKTLNCILCGIWISMPLKLDSYHLMRRFICIFF